MRPLSDHTPKPLLCIGGQALIVYHLQNLARSGIRDIVINLGFLGEKIEQLLGNGSRFGVRLQYSYEDPILETGGGIAKVLSWLGPEAFIALSGDLFTDFPFERLLAEELTISLKEKRLAHLVLVDNPPHNPKGDFALLGNRVQPEGSPLYNFAGIGVYHPHLFENCPEGAFRLPMLFNKAFKENAITGEYYKGLWHNIGTPEQLKILDESLRSKLNS